MCDRRRGAVITTRPDVNDGWNRDDYGCHLGNTQHERDGRQHARRRYAGEQQRQPDEDCLNEGDADDAERDGADGCRAEFGEGFPSCAPATRTKIARLLRAPDSPYAITMLAMRNETKNINRPLPRLVTIESAFWASSPIFGCMLCTDPGRSV